MIIQMIVFPASYKSTVRILQYSILTASDHGTAALKMFLSNLVRALGSIFWISAPILLNPFRKAFRMKHTQKSVLTLYPCLMKDTKRGEFN